MKQDYSRVEQKLRDDDYKIDEPTCRNNISERTCTTEHLHGRKRR